MKPPLQLQAGEPEALGKKGGYGRGGNERREERRYVLGREAMG
jgi:hypothetical protein